MADRIEYEGVPLPSGLPGFGGGTVEVLVLPGFNTVVAPLQFGPVVDAINANPPDPTPPSGSNPDDPTDEVVDPGPPPPGPGLNPTYPPNFCEECQEAPDYGQNPLLSGYRRQVGCVPCGSTQTEVLNLYTSIPAASGSNRGVYWSGESAAGLRGEENGKAWALDEAEFRLGINDPAGSASLNTVALILGNGGALETSYEAGPTIKDPDGREYTPQALDVCEGGQTKTWYVLAYKE